MRAVDPEATTRSAGAAGVLIQLLEAEDGAVVDDAGDVGRVSGG